MSHAVDDLWTIAGTLPHVDAQRLAQAVDDAAQTNEHLDYRTRLLIRDSLAALQSHWGIARFRAWLANTPSHEKLQRVADPDSFDKDPDEIGFPTLRMRIVDVTKPQDIADFFKALARYAHHPMRVDVGGSISLMLRDLLLRKTDDIVVDEVPADLRDQHQALEALARRFGLKLAHFQSHYLPLGWERRLQSFAVYDHLHVYLVDPYDVMVSKVCSKREKDLDDLRALRPRIGRGLLKSRLLDAGRTLLTDSRSRQAAKDNWRFLYDEELSPPA